MDRQDQNDSTWHQAQLDEQQMLSADPAYVEWLKTIETSSENYIDIRIN